MSKVLIVYHSIGGNTRAAAEALGRGAESVAGTELTIKEALKATINDLLSCDGIAVGTPDYFSYMAGGLKDFFDRTFYPTQGQVTDKPCVIFVTHGGGGRAVESVKSVVSSFKFKVIADPVLVRGRPDSSAQERLAKAGKALARACS
jgi:flavorubredoxin